MYYRKIQESWLKVREGQAALHYLSSHVDAMPRLRGSRKREYFMATIGSPYLSTDEHRPSWTVRNNRKTRKQMVSDLTYLFAEYRLYHC